jgi:peroxiredoxin (alkyl hydroperoxide reductase subunit C)
MAVLVGKKAPTFKAAAVLGNGEIDNAFDFAKAIQGKYAVVFFYPMDFTFVCPSELIAFDHRIDEFTKRNVEVIGISIDSEFVHSAWRNTPVNNGGIGPVRYTLVADTKREIMQAYDVESEGGVAFRGSFLIDREGIVRHQIVNDLPLGRDIGELLRVIDALQFTEEHGEVCPAGWNKGDKGMKPSTAGVADYLSQHANKL